MHVNRRRDAPPAHWGRTTLGSARRGVRFLRAAVLASLFGRHATADARRNVNSEVALGTNRGASITKRERERARQQRQREKAERRAQRHAEKKEHPPREAGVDPDIAGIIPGPQPREPEDY